MKITASIQKGKTKDLDKLAKKFKELQNQYVEIGYFDNEMHSEAEMSYASLMTILEFGSPENNIPARYPFHQVAHTKLPSDNAGVKKAIKDHLKNIMGKSDSSDLLAYIGKYYQKELKAIFGDTSRLEPNAPATVAIKGRNEPLVDTQELRDNLGYRTSKEKDIKK